jgi:predicted DsbA family dithiol-disulfide isomerase
MNLEFWCDIICGLAAPRLEHALAAFEHGAKVQVIHRSFQLHPDLDRNGVTQRDLLVMRVPNPTEEERTVLRPTPANGEAIRPRMPITQRVSTVTILIFGRG